MIKPTAINTHIDKQMNVTVTYFTKYKIIIFINSYSTHTAKSRHDGELIEDIRDNMFLDFSCYHHCFMTVSQDNYNVQLVQNSEFAKYMLS